MIAGAKKDVRTQKRTLAQARAVVKDIKQSRGFYQKGKSRGKGRGGKGPCFICGGPHKQEVCPRLKDKSQPPPKGKNQHVGAMAFNFGGWDAGSDDEIVKKDDHPSGEGQPTPPGAMLLGCPVKLEPRTEKEMADTSFGEMAFTSFETAYNEMHRALAGLEDETEGCMVLDCGATKTFGSIKALEKIIEKQRLSLIHI